MNKYNFDGFIRINKTKAKRLYNAGKEVYMVPCKLRLNTWYFEPYIASKARRYEPISNDGFNTTIPLDNDFETIVTCFTYYNCQYNEVGKYPAYYIKEEAASNAV